MITPFNTYPDNFNGHSESLEETDLHTTYQNPNPHTNQSIDTPHPHLHYTYPISEKDFFSSSHSNHSLSHSTNVKDCYYWEQKIKNSANFTDSDSFTKNQASALKKNFQESVTHSDTTSSIEKDSANFFKTQKKTNRVMMNQSNLNNSHSSSNENWDSINQQENLSRSFHENDSHEKKFSSLNLETKKPSKIDFCRNDESFFYSPKKTSENSQFNTTKQSIKDNNKSQNLIHKMSHSDQLSAALSQQKNSEKKLFKSEDNSNSIQPSILNYQPDRDDSTSSLDVLSSDSGPLFNPKIHRSSRRIQEPSTKILKFSRKKHRNSKEISTIYQNNAINDKDVYLFNNGLHSSKLSSDFQQKNNFQQSTIYQLQKDINCYPYDKSSSSLETFQNKNHPTSHCDREPKKILKFSTKKNRRSTEVGNVFQNNIIKDKNVDLSKKFRSKSSANSPKNSHSFADKTSTSMPTLYPHTKKNHNLSHIDLVDQMFPSEKSSDSNPQQQNLHSLNNKKTNNISQYTINYQLNRDSNSSILEEGLLDLRLKRINKEIQPSPLTKTSSKAKKRKETSKVIKDISQKSTIENNSAI